MNLDRQVEMICLKRALEYMEGGTFLSWITDTEIKRRIVLAINAFRKSFDEQDYESAKRYAASAYGWRDYSEKKPHHRAVEFPGPEYTAVGFKTDGFWVSQVWWGCVSGPYVKFKNEEMT